MTRRRLLAGALALAVLPQAARAGADHDLRAASGKDWAPWRGPTPPLALPDMTGAPRSLAQFPGSVVLLNFWASWCEPCRDEIPALSALQDRHRDAGLRLVAVNIGESAARIAEFTARWPITGLVLQDRNSALLKPWRAIGMPANYLIGRGGEVKYWHLGELDWSAAATLAPVTALLRV